MALEVLFVSTITEASLEGFKQILLKKKDLNLFYQDGDGYSFVHRIVAAKNVDRIHNSGKNSKIYDEMLDLLLKKAGESKSKLLELKDKRNQATALILAIANSDFESSKKLIDEGADVNSPTVLGYTAIHGAVRLTNPQILKLLLANENTLVEYGGTNGTATALYQACFFNIPENLKLLIMHGFDTSAKKIGLDVSKEIYNKKPIDIFHFVTVKGYTDCLEVLLETGIKFTEERLVELLKNCIENNNTACLKLLLIADSNLTINNHVKLLSYCIKHSNPVCLNILLNLRLDTSSSEYSKLIFKCVENDTGDYKSEAGNCITVLLNHGVQISVDENKRTALSIANKASPKKIKSILALLTADYNFVDPANRETPIHRSIRENDLDLFQKFIAYNKKNAKYNLKEKNVNNFTPLIFATSSKSNNDFLKKLLQAATESNLDLDINATNIHNLTALAIATLLNSREKFQLLLEAGADFNILPATIPTMFFIAAAYGADQVIPLIYDANIAINTTNHLGNNALYYAAQTGHVKCVTAFAQLMSPEEINHENPERLTALHAAARSGNLECLKELVKYGAKQSSDQLGWTPLHYAVVNNKVDCVEELMAMNVDFVSALNGDTPLHIAAQAKNENIVRYLLEHPNSCKFLYSTNNDGKTPYDLLVENGLDAIVTKIEAENKAKEQATMTMEPMAQQTDGPKKKNKKKQKKKKEEIKEAVHIEKGIQEMSQAIFGLDTSQSAEVSKSTGASVNSDEKTLSSIRKRPVSIARKFNFFAEQEEKQNQEVAPKLETELETAPDKLEAIKAEIKVKQSKKKKYQLISKKIVVKQPEIASWDKFPINTNQFPANASLLYGVLKKLFETETLANQPYSGLYLAGSEALKVAYYSQFSDQELIYLKQMWRRNQIQTYDIDMVSVGIDLDSIESELKKHRVKCYKKNGNGYQSLVICYPKSKPIELVAIPHEQFNDKLYNRDFTISGLLININKEFTLPAEWLFDLQNRTIRCIDSAADSFNQDFIRKIRLLRLFDKLKYFGFYIEDETLKALRDPTISFKNSVKASKEQLRQESLNTEQKDAVVSEKNDLTLSMQEHEYRMIISLRNQLHKLIKQSGIVQANDLLNTFKILPQVQINDHCFHYLFTQNFNFPLALPVLAIGPQLAAEKEKFDKNLLPLLNSLRDLTKPSSNEPNAKYDLNKWINENTLAMTRLVGDLAFKPFGESVYIKFVTRFLSCLMMAGGNIQPILDRVLQERLLAKKSNQFPGRH